MTAPRADVLAYAQEHGSRAAAEHFNVSANTIRSWRARERRRAGREAADRERAAGASAPASNQPEAGRGSHPSPAQQYADDVARIVAWATAGACLRCGGAGYLPVNTPAARERTPALAGYRYARRVVCPDCGGPSRTAVVVGTARAIELRAAAADAEANRAAERRAPGGHREAWRR